MAVTVRNRQIEAQIHSIGKRLGKGPTDVLRQLLEDHRAQEEVRKAALIARRQRAAVELMAMLPTLTEEQRQQSRDFEASMYDETGLPVQSCSTVRQSSRSHGMSRTGRPCKQH
jgi:hypothetical protein